MSLQLLKWPFQMNRVSGREQCQGSETAVAVLAALQTRLTATKSCVHWLFRALQLSQQLPDHVKR